MNRKMAIVISLLLVCSSPVYAKCRQAQLAGNWYAFFSGILSVSAQKCLLKIEKTGSIQSKGCSVLASSFTPDQAPPNITDGTAVLDRQCRATVQINFDNGISTLIDVQLDIEKKHNARDIL
jgi:hypothetical protein